MTAAVKNGSDLDGNVFRPTILADDRDVDAAEEDGDASTAMSSLDRNRLLLPVLMILLRFEWRRAKGFKPSASLCQRCRCARAFHRLQNLWQ